MAKKELKYPPEFKTEVCEYAKKESIVSASRNYNVNEKTVSGWIKLYRNHGTDIFYVKKKRGDNKKRKIFDDTFIQIVKYKSAYPDTTLKELRNRFVPDCSLVSIMNKLRQAGLAVIKKRVEKQRLSMAYKVYSERSSCKSPGKIFRIEVYDNLSETRFFGLSKDCSLKSMDIFLTAVLNILRMRKKLTKEAEVVTNVHFLSAKNNAAENSLLAKKLFKIPIIFESDLRKYNIRTNDKQSRNKGIHEVYVDSYIKAFKNNQIEEFLPVIDVNKINKEYSNYADEFEKILTSIPLQSNKIVLEALDKIDKIGDNSAIKYDYERAIENYAKIYSISVKCKESEVIRIKSMYKTALMYYKIDNFEVSKLILTEILELREKCRSGINPGKAHYYLGKISQIKNDFSRSSYHFGVSVKLLNDSAMKNKYLYYQAVFNRSINEGNYESALRYANKYLANALNKNDAENICTAYDLKGQSNFFLKKYKVSIKNYQLQKNTAEVNQLPEQEINALSNIVNIYTQFNLVPESDIQRLVELIEKISDKIKMKFNLRHCNHLLGSYYYNSRDFVKALKYYNDARVFYKKINFVYYYVINLYSVALCHYTTGNFSASLKYFRDVIKYENSFNLLRVCYSYNYIGRIYDASGNSDKAILSFKRSIRYANKTNGIFMVGDALNYIAFIYDNSGNKEKAIRYYLRALCAFNKIKDESSSSNIFNNIVFIKEKLHILYQAK